MEFPEKQFKRMIEITDDIGIIQHSDGNIPALEHGYSIDDVARALAALARVPKSRAASIQPKFSAASKTYLDYIKSARISNGLFRNFRNTDRTWREETPSEIDDCYGRTVWALAEFANSQFPLKERNQAEELLLESLKKQQDFIHPRASAFTLIGLSKYLSKKPNQKILAVAKSLSDDLTRRFQQTSDENWKWFSDEITYCYARLPQSLLLFSALTNEKTPREVGINSLDFLIEFSFPNKIFHAIGNKWYHRNGEKSLHDEQTVEAGGMVEACVTAYQITKNPDYLTRARQAFDWFHGKNRLNSSMLSEQGGVYDALCENHANTNQGAESLLSYLLAATSLLFIEDKN